jgi:hypothetical protein
VASLDALRALLRHMQDDAVCVGAGRIEYWFNAASVDPDDGVNVICPSNLVAAQGASVRPGRWCRSSAQSLRGEDGEGDLIRLGSIPKGKVLKRDLVTGDLVGTDISGGGPHTHPESEVDDLTGDLAGKAATAHEHTGYCGASDPRLSDARAPTAHGHGQSDVSGLADALAGKCGASDARLSDARTPVSHGHAPGDVTGTAVVTADSRLSDARAPTAHGHAPSEITGTAVVTADSRLSDARTPTAHSHAPSEVTGTAVVTADSRLSDARVPTSHDNTKHSVAYATASDLSTHTEAAAPHSGHLATTALVGVAKITVGTGQPGSPTAGDLWIDTN